MPSYKPYKEATQGFLLGRKMAKEDRLDKQQETGREALSGMLQKEFPDQNFSGMDTGSIGTVFAFRKAKEAEVLAQKKAMVDETNKKIDRTIDVFKQVTEVGKTLKGTAQKEFYQKAFSSVGGALKTFGVDLPYEEMNAIISKGSDKTLKFYLTEVANAMDAHTKGAITKTELQQKMKTLTADASELDKDEMTTVVNRIDSLNKELEPKGGLKEVNVANEIDTVLGGMFPGYYTNPELRKIALDWYATPEGSRTVQAKAAQYNQSKAPPINVVVPGYQTPEGMPIKTNLRERGLGVNPEGIQKTPSEADVGEARKKTSIDAILDEMSQAFDRAEKALPENATERVAGYPMRKGKAFVQSDPNLTLADSLSKGFLAKFARAAGEVGTMTEGDISRAASLVPSINDTKAVRTGKLKQAKDLYNEIYQRGKRQNSPLGTQTERTVTKKFISKSTGKTKYVYSDGTEEIK